MSNYDEIYNQDNPSGIGTGWIQWKGTSVCMDIHCLCGWTGHVDTDFFYGFTCPKCKQSFAVGQNVKFIPLTPEQVKNWNAAPIIPLEDEQELPE